MTHRRTSHHFKKGTLMHKKTQPNPTVQPLDPREAARRFMAEAKHNWRAALAEVVKAGRA